jgi:hypothetical protein
MARETKMAAEFWISGHSGVHITKAARTTIKKTSPASIMPIEAQKSNLHTRAGNNGQRVTSDIHNQKCERRKLGVRCTRSDDHNIKEKFYG